MKRLFVDTSIRGCRSVFRLKLFYYGACIIGLSTGLNDKTCLLFIGWGLPN
jgi:hypothetical protein